MPFPVSHSTTLTLKREKCRATAGTLIRNILTGLQDEHVAAAHNVANSIYFKGGFGFLGSWNFLLPVSSGTILVQEQGGKVYISYKLKFKKFLVVAGMFVLACIGAVLLMQTDYDGIEVAQTLLLAWLFLFGGNYLLTVLRFPWFIRKSIRSGRL